MNITIGKPCAVCEKGGRINNEDSIYPLPETVNSGQKLFLVCDGVGGADKGEIASSLACESFQSYFSTFQDGEPSEEFINKAIQYTESRFDDYFSFHPEAKGMATTITMFYTGTKGAILAHVGDSRIYQFRNGEIIYQTEDHSLVNSLLKLGKITLEEVKTHPQRNVILRAIQGSDHPTEADVVVLEDVQPGDYFFMCTDGVLERFTNESLSSVFLNHKTSEDIKDAIMETCYGRTRDNFSFYILPVNNVQESQGVKQNILSFLYSFI
ncbi:PP2C family protein-serine/threonine phosphatase [Parabacteroides bouchesdurhonensis]|uniref:PP2C family protein-serine/threonine phosphatase n=1 Tax=Parabacteroides bouchesdurhonensis TaxID=1936995 RepID=UPI000C854401|nr:protein phosphatase 2C domain-containing protein [Parabacteroides bouchesdurhonensis]